MSDRKYKQGKEIRSIAEFEKSNSDFFRVYFGLTNPQTKHVGFLMSWQYRTLKAFIDRGRVYEAERMD